MLIVGHLFVNAGGKGLFAPLLKRSFGGTFRQHLAQPGFGVQRWGWQSPPKSTIGPEQSYAKNKREVTKPLRQDVAGKLRKWFSEGKFTQSDTVFPKFNISRRAELLRKDLEPVGIPYEDAGFSQVRR